MLLLLTAFPLRSSLISSAVLWRRIHHAVLFPIASTSCLLAIGEISYGQLLTWLVPALPHPLLQNSLALASEVATGAF